MAGFQKEIRYMIELSVNDVSNATKLASRCFISKVVIEHNGVKYTLKSAYHSPTEDVLILEIGDPITLCPQI